MRVHLLYLLLALLLPTQIKAQAAAEKSDRQVPSVTDPCQGGWDLPMEVTQKADHLQDEVLQPGAQQLLDQLRQVRNTSLARNAGMVSATDQVLLDQLSNALHTSSPNSFEAHMAGYYAQFPTPGAFQQLELAMLRDMDRAELIAPRLVNAARKGNTTELALRAKDMKAHGHIAPALYAMADDILASLEPGAVLFAAGEMDAYPLWVEQYAGGRHKDVLVIDQRLLADPAYRTRIWERTQARGEVAGQLNYINALATATTRPVYLSLALGNPTMAPLKDRLYVTGLAMRLSNTPVNNMPLIEARWHRLKKPMDAGPLSKNYLVPGVVLLTYYRAQGDELRASRLEQEVRTMAKALGVTDELVKNGILHH